MKLFRVLPVVVALLASTRIASAGFDVAKIEQITGLKGKANDAEQVFKVSAPRADVNVTVDGVQMAPFMGLTSWAAFSGPDDNHLMVMGDMVLFRG